MCWASKNCFVPNHSTGLACSTAPLELIWLSWPPYLCFLSSSSTESPPPPLLSSQVHTKPKARVIMHDVDAKSRKNSPVSGSSPGSSSTALKARMFVYKRENILWTCTQDQGEITKLHLPTNNSLLLPLFRNQQLGSSESLVSSSAEANAPGKPYLSSW